MSVALASQVAKRTVSFSMPAARELSSAAALLLRMRASSSTKPVVGVGVVSTSSSDATAGET